VGEISPGDGDEAHKRDEPEQAEDPLERLPHSEHSREQPGAAYFAPFQTPQELARKRRCPAPWAKSATVIR